MMGLSPLPQIIEAAKKLLMARARPEGLWVGEVELNPGPTAQAVMLFSALREPFSEVLADGAERYILRLQNPDGGWSTHGGALSDVSVTAECYMALRLLGRAATDDRLQKARSFIEKQGGLSETNPWTQLYLSFLGVIPWSDLFKLPLESVLLPDRFPLSFSRMAYWVKVISMPMALLGALGPEEPLALAQEIKNELSWKGPKQAPRWLIALSDKWARYGKIPGVRARAIKKAFREIESFTEAHGDLGGNTCTAIVVLLCLLRAGFRKTPAFQKGLQCFLNYGIFREVDGQKEWHLQCCQSHVWDTGFALSALAPQQAPQAVTWLKSQQILERRGDWAKRVDVQPGAWCFGDRHQHFPVTDCTALAVLAIARSDPKFPQSSQGDRALKWLLAMQHREGGWSAYENYDAPAVVENFAKFKDIPNGLLDVPKADVTAKVLEALCLYRESDPAVAPALQRGRNFVLKSRNARGLWKGNYGVNYLYGTAFAAKALRKIDGQANEEWAAPVRAFLLKNQLASGGWSEPEESYRNPELAGKGTEASSVQTAWALLGLAACDRGDSETREALRRGARALCDSFDPRIAWKEDRFLGTVFPGMVYFRYELYSYYFPLMALTEVRRLLDGAA